VSQPAFDLAYIQEQWGELSDELYRSILKIFASEAATLCVQTRVLFAEGRREELVRAAHTIKGAAANIGALRLSQSAGALETAATAGTANEALADLLTRVEIAWDAVRAEIEAGRPTLRGT
jgi:HPt (histidine-containing phosphotransfer) domain-containing protein